MMAANDTNTGKSIAVVAIFEVTSVKKLTEAIKTNNSTKIDTPTKDVR